MKKKLFSGILAICLVLGCLACLGGCGSKDSADAVPVQSVSMITGAGNTGVVDRMAGKVVSSNTLEIFKKKRPEGSRAQRQGGGYGQKGRRALLL